MAYTGGSLTTLFDASQQAATKDTLRDLANTAIDVWKETTVKETPVVTGELKAGWYTTKAVWAGATVESKIQNNVEYAPHVEYGTGLWGPNKAKYPITPKKPGGWLRWIDPKTGKEVFARKVMHPGSPGRYMVSKGGDAVKAAIAAGLFEPGLRDWENKVVRGAD